MSSLFKFKKFTIRQDRCSMKIGTDGVLLGAWVNVSHIDSVLDVGTGTGVIALMVAQRTNGTCQVDAVESDEGACKDASENFVNSPWNQCLKLHCTAIQQFKTEQRYSLIISNPPYFRDSLRPPREARRMARHDDTLRREELICITARYLKPFGSLAVILPPTEGEHFKSMMHSAGFSCIRLWTFRARAHKPVERYLMEFSFRKQSVETGEIVLYDELTNLSRQYAELTHDFYLDR